MKGKMKTVICCAASVFALAALSSQTALAAPSTGKNIKNSVWEYRVVADVSTQVNIRAYGSTDSAVIGYLPKGASADLIEKGEEWSHVISNGVEGYIKNEYLAYGSEAKKLARVYGTKGVKTNWDDVRLFAEPNAAADIVETVEGGSEFEILDKKKYWFKVQLDDESVAYVPKEDVKKVIITERAIPVETPAASETVSGAGTQSSAASGSTGSTQNWSGSGTGATGASAAAGGYAETETTTQTTPQAENVSDNPESMDNETTVTAASADDLNLLAAIIYCEAGNQSREGKVAVGAVVLNRVASSSFPNTIREVIYQSGQFTPAYSGSLASALANGVPSSCVEAAQAALNGENPVGGALYFNTGSGKGIKIGAHQFY